MTDRPIRFGIIGGGLMGREFAMAAARWPALLDLDARPEIVAVCDVNTEILDWYRHRFPSVTTFTADYRELLNRSEIEAVYCAVPHHLHGDMYVDVIKAGKHLMGEKPFGIDLQANLEIMRAIEDAPGVFVRVSSEFPFFPGAQRLLATAAEDRLGEIIEARFGFLHSSDLDPAKPINWKRVARLNGEYGCMGDLGMHTVHIPFRLGWRPLNVRAILSNIVKERPSPSGDMLPCDTWDNAVLFVEAQGSGGSFPMTIETKRIAPGEMDTWYFEVLGTKVSMRFSTKNPRTLGMMEYRQGCEQAWQSIDLGYAPPYRTVTGPIFEFGLPDALLQMWAAFVDELAHPGRMLQPFTCATPQEANLSHRLFTAALESEATASVVRVE